MFYKTVGVLKDVCKNFANFTGKYLCGYNLNVNVWLYAFSLDLNLEKTPVHSCFPVSSAEDLSFRTLQGECF